MLGLTKQIFFELQPPSKSEHSFQPTLCIKNDLGCNILLNSKRDKFAFFSQKIYLWHCCAYTQKKGAN